MMTDLWFRNADRAMAICSAEGVSRLTWTRQHIARLRIDGIMYVRQFYMHTAVRPKILIIGIQGSSEYDMFGRVTEPKAVYPTWAGTEDSWEDLERLINEPWGEDKKRCEDLSVPSSLRPVYGQKHRIVIHKSPPAQSGTGKRYYNTLAEVQSEYPNVELFINGSSSYAVMFGLKFKSVDCGLSDIGDKNSHFWLPNGMKIEIDNKDALTKLMVHEDWIRLLGFSVREIIVDQSKRQAFRIRSARWAAKHWADNLRFFRSSTNLTPDEVEASDEEYVPRQTNRIVLRPRQFSIAEADKILCNRCRIQVGCRFYRADSICGLRESPMADLEKYFDSRNAGRIVDGLANIVRLQARRAEALVEQESHGSEINPEVDKALNALFANGVKLAKLVDPNLAGPGTKVQVNVGTGGTASVVSNANPKEMMARIVEALEMQGIPREKITPEMVAGVLKSMAVNTEQQAIEAAAIKFSDLMGGNQSPAIAHPVIMDRDEFLKKRDEAAIEGELVPVKNTGRD